MTRVDVVDAILSPSGAEAVVDLRNEKPELGAQMQQYYDAVFQPSADSASQLSPTERWLVAIRTAAHTNSAAVMDWYEARARATGIDDALIAKARAIEDPWNGDPRTTAIMRHVDLIVTRPVESSRTDMTVLQDAGLTPGGIVALSQVVAYVSYQLRLVATLRALGERK